VMRSGQKFVQIPSDPIYLLSETEVKKVSLRAKVNSTENNPFGADSVRDMWSAIGASLKPVAATGQSMSMAELMGFGQVAPAIASNPTPASSAAGMSGPASSSTFFGFGFEVAEVAPELAPAAVEPEAKKRRGKQAMDTTKAKAVAAPQALAPDKRPAKCCSSSLRFGFEATAGPSKTGHRG